MNVILGSRIRTLRGSKGMTQQQVADEMNCSRQKYARIENGSIDITYSNIVDIAKILRVNPEDITSSVYNQGQKQPLFRGDISDKDDKFEFIGKMINTFYANRRLYYRTRQGDIDEQKETIGNREKS